MCMHSKSRRRSVTKKNTVKNTPKPKSARKSKARIKNRKPKYLSLSLQLSVDKPEPVLGHEDQDHDHDQNPNNPENNNLVDDNVALFFSGGENSAATTLTGLLTSSSSDDKNNHYSYTTNHPCTDTCRGSVLQERALLRTALKKKETDYREEDEKWVVYSEVVDLDQHSTVTTTMKDEEVSSCCEADRKPDIDPVIDRHYNYKDQKQLSLSLKLDYDEVLNAWSDKGSLYLDDPESPQIVPDIYDDFLAYETSFSSHGPRGGWENNGVQYRVPEIMLGSNQSVGTEDLGVEEWKVGQREASVLRYKEKRQNRLFSKRIRYEVRKLNAQNRPRVKGRFVKRD